MGESDSRKICLVDDENMGCSTGFAETSSGTPSLASIGAEAGEGGVGDAILVGEKYCDFSPADASQSSSSITAARRFDPRPGLDSPPGVPLEDRANWRILPSSSAAIARDGARFAK